MKGHLRLSAGGLVLVMALLGLSGGAVRAAAQPTSPLDVVRAFLEAVTNDDTATMMALIDPAGAFVTEPGTADEQVETLGAFVASIAGQGFKVEILSISATGPDTVAVTFTVSGGDIPPLAHPFTSNSNITVTNGKITRWEETLSDQTKADLAASGGAQPGMPTTGAATAPWLPAMLALSLLIMAVGAAFRKADSRSG